MLAPSGDRAVPALFDLLYGHHDACSKWRQGGARITVLSDLCTMTLLVMVQYVEAISLVQSVDGC